MHSKIWMILIYTKMGGAKFFLHNSTKACKVHGSLKVTSFWEFGITYQKTYGLSYFSGDTRAWFTESHLATTSSIFSISNNSFPRWLESISIPLLGQIELLKTISIFKELPIEIQLYVIPVCNKLPYFFLNKYLYFTLDQY